MAELQRYALITEKMPREFLLLQGTGCRYRKCAFCDYHLDVSDHPFVINQPVLERICGTFGVVDVINSGSCLELDEKTLVLLAEIVKQRHIHTLWFESHWLYRNQLADFAKRFPACQVNFRVGVESFDGNLRKTWRKGIPETVMPADLAAYFQGACLLVGVQGQSQEGIWRDLSLAKKYFTYFSVNVFVENSTPLKRDPHLVEWFIAECLPEITQWPEAEILLNNTDLGVG